MMQVKPISQKEINTLREGVKDISTEEILHECQSKP